MDQIKQTCIEDINDLMSESNMGLATKIYDKYNLRVQVTAALMMDLLEAMKSHNGQYIPEKEYSTLKQYLNKYADVEMSKSRVAVEAVKFWSKTNPVNTKYSYEALVEDVSDIYTSLDVLGSPLYLAHYSNTEGNVDSIPYAYVCAIAIRCMVEGRRKGTTGAEEFNLVAKRYKLSNKLKAQFESLFVNESDYMLKNRIGEVLAATERFFANDELVDKKVRECPKCNTASKFKSYLKEGDVLIIYRKPKYIGYAGMLLNKINSKVTGSSFMSIKLIGPGGKSAIGFGAKIGSSMDNTGCKEVPIDYMIETCAGMIAIRHKDIKDVHRKKITSYARTIVAANVKYDYLTIVKTMFTHKKEQLHGAEKILTKEEAQHYYVPMICTTLITAAYRGVSLDPGVDFSDKSAWPVDVLKSDKFQAVATYFIDGEYLK